MPKEYTECVKNYVGKGVSKRTAQSRCAAMYYKRHGITVDEAHKRGIAELPEEMRADLDWELSLLIMTDLTDLGAIRATEVTATEKKATMHGSRLDIVAINQEFIDEFNVVEIVATMVGAHAYTGSGVAVTWTEAGLKSALSGWKYSRVSINHNDGRNGKVLAAFMEGKLVKMVVKVDDFLKAWIKRIGDMIGVSIEACDVDISEENEITKAVGCGVTFVFPPHEPACDQEEGCGIVGGDADTSENDADIVVTTTTNPAPEAGEESDATYNNTEEGVVAEDSEIGDEMTEGEPKTVCAEKHEKMMAEKDSQLEAQAKEIENLKSVVASYEAAKRDALIGELKEFVDTEPYKEKSADEIATILDAVKAFKEKADKEPVVDSGAVVNATETNTDDSGAVVSNQLDEAAQEEKKDKEILDATWAEAEKRGYKRPVKK